MDAHRNIDLLIPVSQIEQLKHFRTMLDAEKDENNKLQLCLAKWKELDDNSTSRQLLFAVHVDVMRTCRLFCEKEREMPTTPDSNVDDDQQWRALFKNIPNAIKVKKDCLKPLIGIMDKWGRERVLHYQWASRGADYCRLLLAIATESDTWDEFAIAVNNVMLRRHHYRKAGESSLKTRTAINQKSNNPIITSDLKEVKKEMLEKKHQRVPQLPVKGVGHGFDKYNIVVGRAFTVSEEPIFESEDKYPKSTWERFVPVVEDNAAFNAGLSAMDPARGVTTALHSALPSTYHTAGAWQPLPVNTSSVPSHDPTAAASFPTGTHLAIPPTPAMATPNAGQTAATPLAAEASLAIRPLEETSTRTLRSFHAPVTPGKYAGMAGGSSGVRHSNTANTRPRATATSPTNTPSSERETPDPAQEAPSGTSSRRRRASDCSDEAVQGSHKRQRLSEPGVEDGHLLQLTMRIMEQPLEELPTDVQIRNLETGKLEHWRVSRIETTLEGDVLSRVRHVLLSVKEDVVQPLSEEEVVANCRKTGGKLVADVMELMLEDGAIHFPMMDKLMEWIHELQTSRDVDDIISVKPCLMFAIGQLSFLEKQLSDHRENYSASHSEGDYVALCQRVGALRGSNEETVTMRGGHVQEFMDEAPRGDKDLVLKLSGEVLDKVAKTRKKFNDLNMFWDVNMDMLLAHGI